MPSTTLINLTIFVGEALIALRPIDGRHFAGTTAEIGQDGPHRELAYPPQAQNRAPASGVIHSLNKHHRFGGQA